MDIYEARRRVIERIIKARYEGNKAAFARDAGLPRDYVTRMLKQEGEAHRKRIGESMARGLEGKLRLPTGSLLNPEGYSASSVPDIVSVHTYVESDGETIPGELDPLARDEPEKRLLVAFRRLLAEERAVELAELERKAQTNLELGKRWLQERMGVTGILSDAQVRDGFRRAAENNGPEREQLLNPEAPAPAARRGPPKK